MNLENTVANMKYIKHILKHTIFSSIFIDIRSYSALSVISINPLEKLKNDKNPLSAETGISPYYFEDGLRKVYPFYFKHRSFCKGRWISRKIFDIYRDEFAIYSEEECKIRINKGLVKVNNKIVELDYVLKNQDLLSSHIHKHELPVLACPIEILFEDDNFLVVDKPPSIPVHPCGLYYNNTILFILANEYKKTDLHVIYRLDRLTSGVLVFTKSSEKSRELHDEMSRRSINKEYVCRVEGNFPDDTVICTKPIKQFHHKIGFSLVHPKGKVCFTEFKKISYNGKSSVVLCKPHTGRTHQIRVHLQYLGHPIINDPVYNSFVFGSVKGKNGVIEKPISDLMEDLLEEHSSVWSFCKVHRNDDIGSKKNYWSYTVFKEYYMNKELPNYKKDSSKITYDENCHFCKRNGNPEQSALGLFLHAYKYETENWGFEAPMPFWASEDWDVA